MTEKKLDSSQGWRTTQRASGGIASTICSSSRVVQVFAGVRNRGSGKYGDR